MIFIYFFLAFMLACSDSNDNGFSDSFSVDDTVATSIFAHTSEEAHVTGDFRMTVVATGVSSGFVKLNDDEILGTSDFHNQDIEETFEINLHEENTIEVEVRGSPGDQLCVRIFEIEEDDTERGIYERCVDREAGPPNNSLDNDVDATL